MAVVMDSGFKDRRRQISEDSEDEYLKLSDGPFHPDDSYKSDTSDKSPAPVTDTLPRPAYTPRRFASRRSRPPMLRGRGKRFVRKQMLSAAATDFSPDVQLNAGALDFVSSR